MAKPDLGTKRQCQNCDAKFFDLNKNPILCPKCGTTFEVAAPVSSARSAPRPKPKEDANEVETENDAETVSLEDADQVEDGKVAAASTDDDSDVDDDSGDDNNSDDDDTFLEEDDEDDNDVSDLIDGDIEDDEER